MPASIAHMIIFENVLSKIRDDKNCEDLVKIFENAVNMKYGRLGAIGPDLPYYGSMINTAISLLRSKPDQPAGIEQWSGQLHSKDPNIFPLKMIEIAWRESDIDAEEWDVIAQKQWAFITGFLTHVAADQIIHPYVNKISGQYYRGEVNREEHRNCEVYQDVVLFNVKNGKELVGEEFNKWIDISSETNNDKEYFRIFLQKAFIEAHAVYPTENEIDKWIKGSALFLRILHIAGPYKSADQDYQGKKENSAKYLKYWLNQGVKGGKPYLDYFNDAVKLGAIYAKAAYELYKINHADFKDCKRKEFLNIIINADLTNPLDNNILQDAEANYSKCIEE